MSRTVEFQVPTAAIGKPTMTRRDKWKKRDCVVAYRAWCDQLRAACRLPPSPSTVEEIEIHALYEMPSTWSAKKARVMLGQRKRTKPDGDNIIKGISDALWKQDQELGDVIVRRRWACVDTTIVRITVAPDSLKEAAR